MHDRITALLFAVLLVVCLQPAKLVASGAPWVSYPSASVTNYGVYHFRKTVDIDAVPGSLAVHISADNRYKFYVNGEEVCYGPAKGDLQTYKYDFINLAPYLRRGRNTLAALVYNHGKDKPMALQSAQTAFMLRATEPAWEAINTDATWKAYRNPAYTPVTYREMLFESRWFYGYYACGPGDRVDGARYPWGWEQPGFDASSWTAAEPLVFDGPAPWDLVPRNIPFMANDPVLPAAVRKVEGTPDPSGFLAGKATWSIPADTEATLLLDYGLLTMGYPDLRVRGGAGSSIQVKYAEALYEAVNLKGHRDQVDGLTMYGVWDVFKPDGGDRVFRPLWKRCFRYVQLVVTTGDAPLEVVSHRTEYSGYPYPEMATFRCDDERLNRIFQICLRTLRMCSGETYYDTPYYEQLSYGGDNRPIASNSIYNSTDDRLLCEVMRLYPQSADSETGLFDSAYPSRFDLTMGSWSLAWTQTLWDYYEFRGDREFVHQFVGAIERVLQYYQWHLNEASGILGTIPVRNFMDWSITRGSIPRREDGQITDSALLTLFYLHTLDTTSALYRSIGEIDKSARWETLAARIRTACRDQFWDADLQLFRDYPAEAIYSQHTNILAILTNVIPAEEQPALLRRVLDSDVFTEYASSYFSFFLFKAMGKVGMEDEFLEHLDFWEGFLNHGLTTTGETGFASHDRSDCHAWAAHPSFYLLSYVCGIRPGSIAFETVCITPHPGPLQSIEASMPHPKGRIEVAYRKLGDRLEATITLPAGLSGIWEYGDVSAPLHPGENRVAAPSK